MLQMYLEIKTKLRDIIPIILSEIIFTLPPIEDEHLPYTIRELRSKFHDPNFYLTSLEKVAMIDSMTKGNNGEKQICVYRDYLLSSMNPSNPSDATKSVRDNEFIRPDIHPCSACHTSLDGRHVVGGEIYDDTYDDMVQSCQRHTHTPN